MKNENINMGYVSIITKTNDYPMDNDIIVGVSVGTSEDDAIKDIMDFASRELSNELSSAELDEVFHDVAFRGHANRNGYAFRVVETPIGMGMTMFN